MARTPSSPTKPSKTNQTRPILQWLMAGLGGLVTLAAIIIVIWEAMQPEGPSGLRATITQIHDTGHGYIAEVRVKNDGLETATSVDIQGVLAGETATATIDYVPGRGHAAAYLAFGEDPSTAQVSVLGWSKP